MQLIGKKRQKTAIDKEKERWKRERENQTEYKKTNNTSLKSKPEIFKRVVHYH